MKIIKALKDFISGPTITPKKLRGVVKSERCRCCICCWDYSPSLMCGCWMRDEVGENQEPHTYVEIDKNEITQDSKVECPYFVGGKGILNRTDEEKLYQVKLLIDYARGHLGYGLWHGYIGDENFR